MLSTSPLWQGPEPLPSPQPAAGPTWAGAHDPWCDDHTPQTFPDPLCVVGDTKALVDGFGTALQQFVPELVSIIQAAASPSPSASGPTAGNLISPTGIPLVDKGLETFVNIAGLFQQIADRLVDPPLVAAGMAPVLPLASPATFQVMLDNADPVEVSVPAGAATLGALVTSVNAALASAGLGSTVVADQDGGLLTLEIAGAGIANTLGVSTLRLQAGGAAVAFGQLASPASFTLEVDRDGVTESATIDLNVAPDATPTPYTNDNADVDDLVDDLNLALMLGGVLDVLAKVDPSTSRIVLLPLSPGITRMKLLGADVTSFGFASGDVVSEPFDPDDLVPLAPYSPLGLYGASAGGRLKYDNLADFITLLETVLQDVSDAPLPTGFDIDAQYDSATDSLLFNFSVNKQFARSIDLNFEDGFDLGPLGTLAIQADASASYSASVNLNFRAGIYLGDLASGFALGTSTLLADLNGGGGVPLAIGMTAANAGPSDGKLVSNVSFNLLVNGTPHLVTVSAASTSTNFDIHALAEDLRDALAAVPVGGDTLADLVEVGVESTSGKLTLEAIAPSVRSLSIANVSNLSALGFSWAGQSGDRPDLVITVGVTDYVVNLDGSLTVGDVITKIEAAAPVTVAINPGQGLTVTTISGDPIVILPPTDAESAPISAAGFALGILGAGSDIDPDILVGEPLHGRSLVDRIFLVEGSVGEDNVAIDVEVEASGIDLSAALGILGLDITDETPLRFQVTAGLRLVDPNTTTPDGRITLAEILSYPLSSIVEVNSPTFDASGVLVVSAPLLASLTGSGDDFLKLSVSLADPNDLSSVQFTATVNSEAFDGLNNLTVAQIIDLVQNVLGVLREAEDVPWLNTQIPLVNRSLGDVVVFLDELLAKLDEMIASVDLDDIADARDQIEAAIANVSLPLINKERLLRGLDRLTAAITELLEAVGATSGSSPAAPSPPAGSPPAGGPTAGNLTVGDPRELPTKIIAVIRDLRKILQNDVPTSTPGRDALLDALDLIESHIPSLDTLQQRLQDQVATALSTALGVPVTFTFDFVDYDGNTAAYEHALVVGLVIDAENAINESFSPQLNLPIYGPVEFELSGDIDLYAGGKLSLGFGARFDALDVTPFVIVDPPTSGPFFNPALVATRLDLNAGFVVEDLAAQVRFGQLQLLSGEVDLSLLRGVRDVVTLNTSGEATLSAAPLDGNTRLVVAKVTGATTILDHEDFEITGTTFRINPSLGYPSGTQVTVVYRTASVGDPANNVADRASLAVTFNQTSSGNTIGAIPLSTFLSNFVSSLDIQAEGVLTGSIDVTFLNSVADDIVTLAVDVGNVLEPQLVMDEDALVEMFANVDFDLTLIVRGIEALLTTLEVGLTSQVMAKLPLIGGTLDTAGTFLGKLRNNYVTPFRVYLESVGGSLGAVKSQVQTYVFNALGPSGLDILGDRDGNTMIDVNDVHVELTQHEFEVAVKLAGGDETSVNFGGGLPGLPIKTDAQGGVRVGWDYEIDLGVGISRAGGFYFILNNDPNDPEFKIDLDVGLKVNASGPTPVPTSMSATLFGITFSATDILQPNGKRGTGFGAQLTLNVHQASSSPPPLQAMLGIGSSPAASPSTSRLYLPDISSRPFHKVFDANLTAGVDVNLALAAQINKKLPSVKTELVAGWSITLSTSSSGVEVNVTAPTFELQNIRIDIGHFLSKIIGPVVTEVDKLLDPIKPVVKFLKAEVPGLSQISKLSGNGPVTFLDLAFLRNPEGGKTAKKFLGILDQVITVVDGLAAFGPGENVSIALGSFSLGGGLLLDPSWTSTTSDSSLLGSFAADPTPATNQVNSSGSSTLASTFATLQRDPDASGLGGLGIKLDILQPINIIKLLLGQTATVITWDIPRLDVGLTFEKGFRPIPAVPPLKVTVGLDIGAFVDLSVGFDTRGVKTGNFLDGFFFGDRANVYVGADIDEMGLSIGARLRASLDIVVASAGIEGELRASIAANWRDLDNNGKLYLDEIASIIKQDGLSCVFDLTGELRAIVRIVWKVLGKSGSKDIINKVLFSFQNQCPKFEPAHVSGGGESLPGGGTSTSGMLILHTGAFAGQRRPGSSTDVAESFTLTEVAPGVVRVEGMGFDTRYGGVSSVFVDGGNGNDHFNLAGIAMPVTLRGGDGNDTLIGGTGLNTIDGGAGNDIIQGGPQADTIYGGSGDDVIHAYGGNNWIDAGAGQDEVYVDDGNNEIYAGAGADLIRAGHGNNTIYGGDGNDDIETGNGNNWIDGGAGRDIIRTGTGSDTIFGGAGDDDIRTPGGNNWIDGGLGRDYIETGAGNDELYGGADNDTILSHGGDNKIWGNAGNDLVIGGPGNDEISGGSGHDIIFGDVPDVASPLWDMLRLLSAHAAELAAYTGGSGSGADVIHGDSGHDFIDAGADNDWVYGGNGNDLVIGGPGKDELFGGYGNDVMLAYLIGDVNDPINLGHHVEGGPNNDFICGTTAGDSLFGGTSDIGLPLIMAETHPGAPLAGGWTITSCVDEDELPVFTPPPLVTLRGRKFEDVNFNAAQDPGEPGVADWTIEVYDDAGELAAVTTTAANGTYEFQLEPGTYTVVEVLASGWLQTYPVAGSYQVTLDGGGVAENLDFGNMQTATVRGFKWLDLDGDGVWDAPDEENGVEGEPGLAGVTIFVDLNDNGVWDLGEPWTTTLADDLATDDVDETGHWVIEGLLPGDYVIREVVPVGYIRTYPVIEVLHENQFEQLDVSRIWTSTATSGKLTIDRTPMNQRGFLGPLHNETVSLSLVDIAPHNAVTLSFNLLVIGSWDGVALGLGPDRLRVLADGTTLVSTSFSNTGAQQGHPEPGPHPPRTGAAENNTLGYADGDSVYSLAITFPHTASTLVLDFIGELVAGISPDVEFWGLDNVKVTILKDGHRVTLVSGQDLDGLDFGNARRKGGIGGTKWLDRNGDGVRNPGEPGVGGVTVYLDLNNDNRLDEGEPSTLTRAGVPGDLTGEGAVGLADLGVVQTTTHGAAGRVGGASSGLRQAVLAVVSNWGANDPETAAKAGVYQFDDLSAGDVYVVREVVPAGFMQTWPTPLLPGATQQPGLEPEGTSSSAPGGHVVTVPSGSVAVADFGNVRPGVIEGFKWHDAKPNGQWDADESGMGGVVIYVDLNNNGQFESNEPSAVSAFPSPNGPPEGYYRITNVPPGTRVVREVPPPGFVQTYPQDSHTVLVVSGKVVPAGNFGNHRDQVEPGGITGLKWDDINGNGQRDADAAGNAEPGMGGVVIYVDVNNNGQRDTNEPSTVTSFGNDGLLPGQYVFSNVPPGTYVVREVVPQGYQQTFPQQGAGHVVTVAAGQVVSKLDFGNHRVQTQPGGITGLKWDDINGNGQRDVDAAGNAEPGMGGVVIYVDVNNNGQHDANEPSTVTSFGNDGLVLGQFAFFNVPPGTYVVREVVPQGYQQTFPQQGAGHVVTVVPGQVVSKVDFGNVRVGNSPGSPQAAAQEEYFARDNCYIYSPNGINVLPPGVLGNDVTPGAGTEARLERPANFGIVELKPDGSFRYQTAGAAEIDQFTYFFFHPVLQIVSNVATVYLVPEGRPCNGSIHGLKWLDVDGDGVRDVGTAGNPIEPGIPGVTIYLDLNGNGRHDQGEPATVTLQDNPQTPPDETGVYWFFNVPPGTYIVRELVPAGFVQTFPQGAHVVTVGPGQRVERIDFGNARDDEKRGIIRGIKWADLNGNTLRDIPVAGGAPEPGMGGVTIYLDLNDNGAREANEPSTVTLFDDPATPQDETGWYQFVGLPPGTYVVREVVPPGHVQTWPFDKHVVTVGPGQTVDGVDFGNHRHTGEGRGIISGMKWDDFDGELGSHDPHEPGVAGVTIYLDLNNNGKLDPSEPSTVTDAGGNYQFSGLPVGWYVVREIVEPDRVQSFPAGGGAHVVFVGPGQVVAELEFGNFIPFILEDGDDEIYGAAGNDTIYGDNLVTDPRVITIGGSDLIFGEDGNDLIYGQQEDDVLDGGWGDDLLDGGDEVDRVTQTVDNNQTLVDLLLTGQGTNTLVSIERGTLTGGAGDNVIDASGFTQGPVILIGLGGDDHLIGTDDDDLLYGGDGNDLIEARGGNDLLVGGTGDDKLEGGAGLNWYRFETPSLGYELDTVTAISGDDTLDFAALPIGYDVLVDLPSGVGNHLDRDLVFDGAPNGVKNVLGGAGNDKLIGNGADNLLDGGAGDDQLVGTAGANLLIGGEGNDLVDGGIDDDTVLFLPGAGLDQVQDNGGTGDVLDFSAITANLTITIGAGSVVVTDGVNTVTHLGNVVERIIGGLGDDTFIFTDGAVLAGGVGTIDGGGGVNTLDYSQYTSGVTVNLTAGTATGTAGVANIRHVFGGSGNDTVTGDAENNRLVGNAGNDLLSGMDGDDVLEGGTGDDTYNGGAGDDLYLFDLPIAGVPESDTLVEPPAGGGYDTLDFSALPASHAVLISLTAGAGLHVDRTLSFVNPSQFDRVIGTPGDDELVGGTAGNLLEGRGGDDLLDGRGGSNTLIGGPGNDRYVIRLAAPGEQVHVVEHPGGGTDMLDFRFVPIGVATDGVQVDLSSTTLAYHNNDPTRQVTTDASLWINIEDVVGSDGPDVIVGNDVDNVLDGRDGDDRLDGGRGDDLLLGGDGNDELLGGRGIDRLIGGAGDNRLVGGPGDDEYVFLAGATGTQTLVEDAAMVVSGIAIIGGTDTLDLSALTTAVTLDLSNAGPQVVATGLTLRFEDSDGNLIADHFENVIGSSTAVNTLTGNAAANVLTGGSANDVLDGGDGNDTLDGGLDDDQLLGGDGNDVLVFDPADVTLVDGGLGTDTLRFDGPAAVDFTTATQYSGIDRLALGDHGVSVTLDEPTVIAISDAGEVRITGGPLDAVTLVGGWTLTSSWAGYDTYTLNTATALVQQTIGGVVASPPAPMLLASAQSPARPVGTLADAALADVALADAASRPVGRAARGSLAQDDEQRIAHRLAAVARLRRAAVDRAVADLLATERPSHPVPPRLAGLAMRSARSGVAPQQLGEEFAPRHPQNRAETGTVSVARGGEDRKLVRAPRICE